MGFKTWICRTFKCGKEPSLNDLDNFDWERYWNENKPKADISYCGRVLPTTKIPLEIDVKLFITTNDFEIYNWLKERNLLTTQKSTAGCNDLILEIYKQHQKEYFLYGSDEDTFGVKELWTFPSELRALRKKGKPLDCDDYGNSLASHLICAGIPEFRVRAVAGTTRRGEGHLTVYCLADDMKTWRHCFIAGTGIITLDGIKNIEEIQIGDKVLSINNKWDNIEEIHKIDNKMITAINSSSFYEDVKSTPDHKYLIIKRKGFKKGFFYPHFCDIKDTKNAEWVEAKNIKRGDLLISTINKDVLYDLDIDFAYLLGQYLGDGNLMFRNRLRKKIKKIVFEPSGLRFIKNNKEEQIVKKIIYCINKFSKNKITKTTNGNVCIIQIADANLASEIIKYAGYSKTKNVGKEILFSPIVKQQNFLLGFIESDGCKTKHRNKDCIKIVQSKVHKNIIKGIMFILKRLEIRYNTSSRFNTKATFKQNDKIISLDIRGLNLFNWKQNQRNGCVNYLDGYCTSFVKSVNTYFCEEDVYDLSTKDTHTYNVEGFIVHNCNSTTSYQNIPIKFDDLPTSKSENDLIGIKDCWFSHNSQKSWHEFETSSAEKSFDNKKFKIKIKYDD